MDTNQSREGNEKFGDADVVRMSGPGKTSLHGLGDYLFQRRGKQCSEKGCKFPDATHATHSRGRIGKQDGQIQCRAFLSGRWQLSLTGAPS